MCRCRARGRLATSGGRFSGRANLWLQPGVIAGEVRGPRHGRLALNLSAAATSRRSSRSLNRSDARHERRARVFVSSGRLSRTHRRRPFASNSQHQHPPLVPFLPSSFTTHPANACRSVCPLPLSSSAPLPPSSANISPSATRPPMCQCPCSLKPLGQSV